MKVKVWIKYEESVIPPRCRKPRYVEKEEYITRTLKEVPMSELDLAFEVQSYYGKGKIFAYKNRLWTRAKLIVNETIAEEYGFKTALDELLWGFEHSSRFFRDEFDRKYGGKPTDRDSVVKAVRDVLAKYMVVDGELFERTAEPRYVINTFGLGHNHGGTGLFVEYGYNTNIRKENYFSALDGDAAVAYANKIAARRGDTNDIGKFHKMIVVYRPDLVKVNPKRQHGDGNPLLNTMEGIISETKDPVLSGLLCIAAAKAEIGKN